MNDQNFSALKDLDYEILKILAQDGRKSLRSIAETLDKSPATIKKHVDNLESRGIIKNYGIKINYEKLGYEIIALIELTISKGKMLEVEKELADNPYIFTVYDLTGTYDALILARFKSRGELSEMVKMINSSQYIEHTNTHIILNVIKEGTNFSQLIDFLKNKKK